MISPTGGDTRADLMGCSTVVSRGLQAASRGDLSGLQAWTLSSKHPSKTASSMHVLRVETSWQLPCV